MRTLSLVTYPDRILKRKAGFVANITPEIKKLISLMIETMYKNQGIGLAAPQIGVSKQIVIVETAHEKHRPLAFVNPTITKKSRKTLLAEEGCLSLPGVFLNVKRAEHIELICQDLQGKPIKIKAEGLTARIFQHEIDHLQGKLIIDRIPIWKRFSVKRSLKSKGKILSPKT
jgi:peptide deformylase